MTKAFWFAFAGAALSVMFAAWAAPMTEDPRQFFLVAVFWNVLGIGIVGTPIDLRRGAK